MASYYVDIIDQVLEESLFVLEQASRSSIVLSWEGGDSKSDLIIVGSNLTFNFAHNELVDAKFIKFFTGNEIRFKVELRNTADDVLIWTGFVLPDQYSEPYTNGVTFVEFRASCGLGRLKGKYLPDDYYRDEKSVIDILCKSLSLTSLGLNVFFNPAIENSVQKDWDKIYLDTSYFVDKKKQDVYSIVQQLLQDMQCVCFQSDNRWVIEGLNKRNIRKYSANLYNSEGVLIGISEGNKLLKKITALVTPTVTMIPPFNEIVVSHKRVPQSLPKTIAQEQNDGWSVMSGVEGKIYATDWNGNNGYYCSAVFPDYYNAILKTYYFPPMAGIPVTDAFNELDFIDLKNKLFVSQYQKLTIKAEFKALKYSPGLTASDASANTNPFFYEILLNDEVYFSNKKTTVPTNENLIFEDGKAVLDFDWIVPVEGLIDFKFYRSGISVYTTNIVGFEIRKLEVSPVAFEETKVVTDLISDEYSIDKEIELVYADDDTAFSKAFRLAKINEATDYFNMIEIPVIDSFFQNGNYYSIVDLKGANLIKDNINTVYYGSELLQNVAVIYNYFESPSMVVKTDFAITTGSFSVNVYKNNDVLGSRAAWLLWTDAVYKIETKGYAQIVANIIRRMYNEPSEKIDLVVLNAIKFSDLVLFDYVFEKYFIVTNCSWDLDKNKTTLTLSRAVYSDGGSSGGGGGNVPPIVNAGIDIELASNQTTAILSAIAYDVDGFIASQVWTKLQGGFGDIIDSPLMLETALQNLTEDVYEYKIEVTDNDGATAFDTVRLVRKKDYSVTLPNILMEGSAGAETIKARYQFAISPGVDPSFNLLLKGRAYLFAYNFGFAEFRIIKNGIVVYVARWESNTTYNEFLFSVGYISTDVIVFEIYQSGRFPAIHIGSSRVALESIDFVSGYGNIIGLPGLMRPISPGF